MKKTKLNVTKLFDDQHPAIRKHEMIEANEQNRTEMNEMKSYSERAMNNLTMVSLKFILK